MPQPLPVGSHQPVSASASEGGALAARARETDRLFAASRSASDFDFGAETAAVFDDMLERSVPFYDEIQRMVAELAVDYATGGAVYDLGCSTCTAFLRLAALLPPESAVRCVGIDSSPEM